MQVQSTTVPKYKGWAFFALALLFFVLGICYLAWWKWTAIPPTPADSLREVSGTILTVEDISRSADSIHPILDLHIARADGRRTGLYIRNRNVTLKQFRALTGGKVRVRYSGETGVIYEFFVGDQQLIDYEASYRQELESYSTMKGAAKLVFVVSAVFVLLGLLSYFWARLGRKG